MSKYVVVSLVGFLFIVTGCNLMLTPESDEIAQLEQEIAELPEPHASLVTAESRSISTADIESFRKLYGKVFFANFEDERAIASLALLPSSFRLDVTSNDPSRVPFAGTYEGRRSIFFGYLRQFFRAVEILDLDVQYQLADENYLSSHIEMTFRVLETGKTLDAEYVFLWEYDGGLFPKSARIYYDTELFAQAFEVGGADFLQDTRNPEDDFRIGTTTFDIGQIVATLYDNFYAGRIDDVIPTLSPDVAIYFKGQEYPFAGVYKGIPEILQFVEDLAGTAAPFNIELFLVEEGDRVDVVLFEEWTAFETGKDFSVHTVNSWRINEEGLLLGFSNYPDSLEVAQAYAP